MSSNIIRGGYDYPKSFEDGLYAFYPTNKNLSILSENQGQNILVNLYPSKNSLIPIQVSISKYSYRIINDSELNYLKQKYHWEPVQPKYGTNWKLLIEFQYSNVVFPKSTKIQTNTITRYFQKQ